MLASVAGAEARDGRRSSVQLTHGVDEVRRHQEDVALDDLAACVRTAAIREGVTISLRGEP